MFVASAGPLGEGTGGAVRYYSLARYALLDALRLFGVGRGHRVLLPSFLCREVLAPITMLGATPCWYEIEPGLTPVGSPDMWPEAAVVLAINYFGFAQDMAPFVAYSHRTGAKIIEDNAHGYLSRDAQGRWLGTRAPLGLFSLRKTIRIPDGAALSVNEALLVKGLPEQLPFDENGLHQAQVLKTRMRHIPLIGSRLLRIATFTARGIRKYKTGSAAPLSDPLLETQIGVAPNPWIGLLSAVAQLDNGSEIVRRREAYSRCALEGQRCGVAPVFTILPDHCVPYGYPFRGDDSGCASMRRVAGRMGFDLVAWPNLPNVFERPFPAYYRNVFMVNFLW